MDKGERAIRFIENLKLPEGVPFVLQPWQKDYIRRLFSTLGPDGLRQYRDSLLFLPKKNGKSTLLAAIAIYCLFNEPQGSRIISAANSRDQASICFDTAAAMIRSDRWLKSQVKLRDSRKTIYYPKKNSLYRAISADADDKNGANPTLVIYDELADAPDSELYDILTTAMAARPQPLMVVISTAGWDQQSVMYRLYKRARQILDGTLTDPTFLPVIYEAAPGDDWKLESTWRKANPNFGITVQTKHMEKMVREAIDSPTTLNRLLRYHLNIWTESDVAWLSREKWQACGQLPLDPATLAGKPCYVGLDLASTGDTASAVLVFPLTPQAPTDPRWAVLPRIYCPAEAIHRRSTKDRVPYDAWARDGHLITTDGNVIDYDFIRRDLNQLKTVYDIREIAIDRWNATQLSTQLEGDGFKVIPFGQGFASMAAPCKELEKAVISVTLAHGNHPVLDWMAANVVAVIDPAENIKPDKARSREKIDAMVALVMGIGRAIAQPVPEPAYTGSLVL